MNKSKFILTKDVPFEFWSFSLEGITIKEATRIYQIDSFLRETVLDLIRIDKITKLDHYRNILMYDQRFALLLWEFRYYNVVFLGSPLIADDFPEEPTLVKLLTRIYGELGIKDFYELTLVQGKRLTSSLRVEQKKLLQNNPTNVPLKEFDEFIEELELAIKLNDELNEIYQLEQMTGLHFKNRGAQVMFIQELKIKVLPDFKKAYEQKYGPYRFMVFLNEDKTRRDINNISDEQMGTILDNFSDLSEEYSFLNEEGIYTGEGSRYIGEGSIPPVDFG